jgi:hypothetical protein
MSSIVSTSGLPWRVNLSAFIVVAPWWHARRLA